MTISPAVAAEERKKKDELSKKFSKEEIHTASEIFTRTEVTMSYLETIWKKGMVLLDEVDKAGYKLVKK